MSFQICLFVLAWGAPVWADPDNGPDNQPPAAADQVDSHERPSTTPVKELGEGPESRSLGQTLSQAVRDSRKSLGGGYIHFKDQGDGFTLRARGELGRFGDGVGIVDLEGGRILTKGKERFFGDVKLRLDRPSESEGKHFNGLGGGRLRFLPSGESVGIQGGARYGDRDGNEVGAQVIGRIQGTDGVEGFHLTSLAPGVEIFGTIRPTDWISLRGAARALALVGTGGKVDQPNGQSIGFTKGGTGHLLELEGTLNLHVKEDSEIFVTGALEKGEIPIGQKGQYSGPLKSVPLSGARVSAGAAWSF